MFVLLQDVLQKIEKNKIGWAPPPVIRQLPEAAG